MTPKRNDSGDVIEVSGTFSEATVDDENEEADSYIWARIEESTRYNAASDEFLSNVLMRVRDDDRAGFDDLPEISIAPVSSAPVVEGGFVEYEMTASPQFTTPTNVYLVLQSVGGEYVDIEAYGDEEVDTDGDLRRYTLGSIVNFVYQLQIEFPADASTLRFSVPTKDDKIDELDGELVALIYTLGTPPYRIIGNQDTVNLPLVGNVPNQHSSIASVTVLDNDAAPIISIAGVSGNTIAEGESAEFVITADRVSLGDKTINVNHTDGDADFISLTTANHVVLPGGALTARYFVHTDDDNVVETAGGTITVALLGDKNQPIGYAINTDQAMNTVSVSVTDNDVARPAPLPEISVVARQQYVDEFSGALYFDFNSSIEVTTQLDVTVNLSQGQGENFIGTPTPGDVQVSFEAGSDKAELRVTIPDDTTTEENGTITATISDGTSYTISEDSGSASVTVLDDDSGIETPVIRITAKSPTTVTEGPAANPTNAVFTISSTNTNVPAPGVVVKFEVSDGDGDFINNPPTSILMSNTRNVDLEIPIVADDIAEADGEITVKLLEDLPESETDTIAYTINSVPGRETATVAVLDDDATPPVIGIQTATGSTTVTEGNNVVFEVVDLRGANGTPLDETITVRVDVSEDQDFLIED